MRNPIKRGRPAKLSPDQIVAEAVELIMDASGKPFSIHRLAGVLEVTPMAIYRHFRNKDELMQAVAQQLMDGLQPQIPEADWPEQLRAWAFAARAHFLEKPALFGILGWKEHIAGAWLRQIAVIGRIVTRTGLQKNALAEAVQWTANTLMGSIYFEISSRDSGYRVSPEDLESLPPEDARIVKDIMKRLLQKDADAVFGDCVERVIEALRARSQAPVPGLPASAVRRKIPR
jgi:AcrR family transcriptional regulator